MAERLTVKCFCCNHMSLTASAKRHYRSRACQKSLDGVSEDDAYSKMRAAAHIFTKRQVVTQSSLVNFTESCCADIPLFSAIPADTLLQFSKLLLQAHGTTIDSDNLKSSFVLPTPPNTSPAPTPSTASSASPAPTPAPSSSLPATQRRAKRRRSPSPAPRQSSTSQPRPTPDLNPHDQPVPVCCSDGSVSADLADAHISPTDFTVPPVSSERLVASQPSPNPTVPACHSDLIIADMFPFVDSNPTDGAPPLSPMSLVAPRKVDILRASLIDSGCSFVCPSPPSKRAKLLDAWPNVSPPLPDLLEMEYQFESL